MKRVLIVDDSRLSRSYHTYILTNAGFSVETACEGAEALEKLMLEPFDAMLTDINMRGMDGYELIRRVRAEETLEPLPILIISTEASEEDRGTGFAAGANFYLVKPADPQKVVESVRMMVEGQ